jgi:alkanesulfonate monooxygenase SsuD/methylene tetrahydromethanopterin reductase-like flavin-dependent oxidoreductase (luciferase family)
MEFGIFDHLDRGEVPLTAFFEQRLQIVETYDRNGFFCYHLAEHHGRPVGMAPSPSVFLSAVAQRTKRLRFGPLVYLLPFYHPLRLVEEICMLDQMSGGRLEVGTGRGILPMEAKFYDLDPAELQSRYDESLAILRLALSSDTVTFEGKYHRFDRVPMEVPPLQVPMPPFWYGVHGAESAERAVRAGFNVVTNEGTEPAKPVIETCRRVLAELPSGTSRRKFGLVRFILVAPTDAEAREIGRRAYARWHDSFYRTQRRLGATTLYEKSPNLDVGIEEGTVVAGSPATVLRALRDTLDVLPINYLAGQFAFGDLTVAEACRSIELFSRDIMPELRGA